MLRGPPEATKIYTPFKRYLQYVQLYHVIYNVYIQYLQQELSMYDYRQPTRAETELLRQVLNVSMIQVQTNSTVYKYLQYNKNAIMILHDINRNKIDTRCYNIVL